MNNPRALPWAGLGRPFWAAKDAWAIMVPPRQGRFLFLTANRGLTPTPVYIWPRLGRGVGEVVSSCKQDLILTGIVGEWKALEASDIIKVQGRPRTVSGRRPKLADAGTGSLTI